MALILGGKIMNNNPLKKLEALGQSVWLDYIRKDLLASGELRRLIDEDGLHGGKNGHILSSYSSLSIILYIA
jgi:hypothetical protein